MGSVLLTSAARDGATPHLPKGLQGAYFLNELIIAHVVDNLKQI